MMVDNNNPIIRPAIFLGGGKVALGEPGPSGPSDFA